MIDILLATYNGRKHLAEQLDSLCAQTHSDWRLLIHDDGSSDGTVDLEREYQRKFPSKIFLIEDNLSGLGAKDNFAHLMSVASSDYVMFCDQDDVWLPNKIAKTLKMMAQVEGMLGKTVPIGVFSDLRVVDERLKPVADSLWAYLRTSPLVTESARQLAVRNCLVGCTLLINKRALELSVPVPREAIMHDWWVGLMVLKNKGKLIPLWEPTVLYRQHESNAVGARRFSFLERLHAARKCLQFLGEQQKVYRMSKRAGIIGNWPLFILTKCLVLARMLTEHR